MSTKLEFDAVARWMRVSRPQLGRMLKHPLAPRPTIETSQARWYRDEIAQWRAELS
jgi:predicted DNA-binding transcriptional regulator AlpA